MWVKKEIIALGGKSKLEFGSLDATLNRVPYALTISDLSAEDHPLVFMNNAFRTMTGCTDAQLGQNCRFLQADFENEQARAEIRLALETGQRTQVVLRNRRMDGKPFSNLLLLEPIKTADCVSKLALGAQFALTDSEVLEIEADKGVPKSASIEAAHNMALSLRLERRRIAANSAVQLLQSWLTLKELS